MISEDSILRRLPHQLDRQQALFFDGIRHCAEIADLAYGRLKSTLTQIASTDETPELGRQLYTSAFLDAWALVDVLDRFRALWNWAPDAEEVFVAAVGPTFSDVFDPIRDVRNVADHITGRVEYFVAHDVPALGVLSWVTVTENQPLSGLVYAIVPGTFRDGSFKVVNPAGMGCEYPTGLVHVSAGKHTANLTAAFEVMRTSILELEAQISEHLPTQIPHGDNLGADVLIRVMATPIDLEQPH
jgi:hypothetical protein